MFNEATQSVIVFTVFVVILLALFSAFIFTIIYRFRQKQFTYFKELEALKVAHKNDMLQAQLEMQENTFQKISREIHDNIGQKLSLAKLYLNSIAYLKTKTPKNQVSDSLRILTEVINELSDITRSMNPGIILNNGLLNGIEFLIVQLQKPGIYIIDSTISGMPVSLDIDKELMLFRIIQESLHNIMKHAEATKIGIYLDYRAAQLVLAIKDNGRGFEKGVKNAGSGLMNIQKRALLLGGDFVINSGKGGTELFITVPIKRG